VVVFDGNVTPENDKNVKINNSKNDKNSEKKIDSKTVCVLNPRLKFIKKQHFYEISII